VESNEGELANIVSKIPDSSRCADEDVNEGLNCDRDDPRYDIMTDDETVDNLRSKEVTANDNEDDVDEEEQNVPSYRDDLQALDLAIAWMERQHKCDPLQLLQVKRIR
jgi:hypothetical protein